MLFDEAIEMLNDGVLSGLDTAKYGELDLSETIKALTELRRELFVAHDLDSYKIPRAKVGPWVDNTLVPKLRELIDRGDKFIKEGPTAVDRDQLASDAEALYDAWCESVRPFLPRPDSDESATEARLNKRIGELDQKATELDSVISANRVVAAESVTSELAKHYATERDDRKKAANLFLVVGVLGLLLFVGLSVAVFELRPIRVDPTASTTERSVALVTGSLARLVLLSAAAFIATFGFRNYRVNKHLETLSSRRVIALNTSSRLREAMEESDQRALVVSELVRSIFASDETGYLGGSPPDRVVIDGPGGAATAGALSRSIGGGSGSG